MGPFGTRVCLPHVGHAASPGADGASGAHVDIDVCNYAGGGRFRPLDPTNPSCGSDKTWDVFWHDGAGDDFMNQASSAPCEMTLADNGATLDGTFSCRGLVERQGPDTLDVLDGFFRCTVD